MVDVYLKGSQIKSFQVKYLKIVERNVLAPYVIVYQNYVGNKRQNITSTKKYFFSYFKNGNCTNKMIV